MDVITRQGVLDLLERDWAHYVDRYQHLPAAGQALFLEKQGYKRLADLLAHIVAWWEVGLQNIRSYQSDPTARQPEIDVDSFNAQAVQAVRGVTDAEEIQVFETTRKKFAGLVQELSEADFQDERVLDQIRWELVNHLEDHRIQ